MRFFLNKIVVKWQKSGNYPIKNALFNILSLANQLYRSKSIILDGPGTEKTYFSENQILNLPKKRKKNLYCAIDLYNDIITKNKVLALASNVDRKYVQISELV